MHIAVLLLSIIIVSAIQLLLCMKAGKFKIIPVTLFGILTLLSVIMSFITKGWTSFGYVLLSIYFACLVLACGLGFLIKRFIKK